MLELVNFDLRKEIEQLYNIHKDETCVIVGSGPTLNDAIPFFEYAKKHNFILLGTNETLFDTTFDLDYHFLGDITSFDKGKECKRKYLNIRTKKKKIWFGSCVQKMPVRRRKKRRKNAISNNLLQTLNSNSYLDVLIFDKLSNRKGLFSNLTHSHDLKHSTIFVTLEIALLMGFNKIYLVGCDCTQTNKYRPNEIMNYFDYNTNTSRLIKGWNIMNQFIRTQYPKVVIKSVNPIGLSDLIPEDITIKNIYSNI